LIVRADIAITGSRIAAIGNVEYTVGPETEVIDCRGLYLLPGFVDSHMHMGGSQAAIQGFAELVVPHGTAAVATDFYEIGTIAGISGVLSELEASADTGLDILLSACHFAVLGVGKFANPGRFSFDDMHELMAQETCVELREW